MGRYLLFGYSGCLPSLEGGCIFKKTLTYSVHFPTFFLIVGFPLYWIELYFLSSHKATVSPIAWLATLSLFIVILIKEWSSIVAALKKIRLDFGALSLANKIFVWLGAGLCFFILLVGLYASRLAPHLPQEFDVINYHITIPRQHLLMGSFEHLRWSSADFFLLPMDFALTPFWLIDVLPNKWPQFVFLIGLVLVCWSLMRRLGNNDLLSKVLVVFAVLGAHSVGIQVGTAMMGLAEAYLFLACIDSFLRGSLVLSAIEAAFFIWSKSFRPLEVGLILVAIIVSYYLLKKIWGKNIQLGFTEGLLISADDWREYRARLKRMVGVFVLASLVIAGPFLFKSLYYSGTPLYPFGAGMVMINKNIDQNSLAWQAIKNNSQQLTDVKNTYGMTRTLTNFIEHLWLIGVPEDNVNNRFDYPLGLVYLLCLGLFLSLFIQSLRHRQFLLFHFWVVMGWLCWWMGSQQSRFLYVPLFLMFISVVSVKRFQTVVFRGCILIALALTTLSVFRANAPDFKKSSWEVLRPEDQEFVQMAKIIPKDQRIVLQRQDVAFAPFLVSAVKSDEILVLQF